MLSDGYPEMKVLGPKSVGGTPVTISVYVEGVDDVFVRELNARDIGGGRSSRVPQPCDAAETERSIDSLQGAG
jgi:hypothetical protein